MIYIIMGVSGSGKTSLGMFLSEKLGWPFCEGDDFHPPESIEKMARGEPLTDQLQQVTHNILKPLPCEAAGDTHSFKEYKSQQDRFPWLLKLHEIIERERSSGSDALMACSALKRQYRQILLHGSSALAASSCPHQNTSPPTPADIFFLYLHGDYDLIYQRMVARKGHYMKADLLRSQFDILEPPSDEENVLPLDTRKSTADLALEVEKHVLSLKILSPRQ